MRNIGNRRKLNLAVIRYGWGWGTHQGLAVPLPSSCLQRNQWMHMATCELLGSNSLMQSNRLFKLHDECARRGRGCHATHYLTRRALDGELAASSCSTQSASNRSATARGNRVTAMTTLDICYSCASTIFQRPRQAEVGR